MDSSNQDKDQDQDIVTRNIGVFGKFQLKCFLLVQFVGVFAAWQVLVSTTLQTTDIVSPSKLETRNLSVRFRCEAIMLSIFVLI